MHVRPIAKKCFRYIEHRSSIRFRPVQSLRIDSRPFLTPNFVQPLARRRDLRLRHAEILDRFGTGQFDHSVLNCGLTIGREPGKGRFALGLFPSRTKPMGEEFADLAGEWRFGLETEPDTGAAGLFGVVMAGRGLPMTSAGLVPGRSHYLCPIEAGIHFRNVLNQGIDHNSDIRENYPQRQVPNRTESKNIAEMIIPC
jgi:hypothetical protein